MVLTVFTDGGSKGNPGPAAIGYIAYLDEKEVFKGREDIGIGTNNEAEYKAVLRALEKVKELVQKKGDTVIPNLVRDPEILKQVQDDLQKIELRSDSTLLVNQVNGFFKVKNGKIKEYILAIRGLEQEIGLPISYINIPREENTAADGLVNNKKI